MRQNKKQNKQNVKKNNKSNFKTDNKINKKKFDKGNINIKAENINNALKRGDIIIDKKQANQLNNNKQVGKKSPVGKKGQQKSVDNVKAEIKVKEKPESTTSPNNKQKMKKFKGTATLTKENNLQNNSNITPSEQKGIAAQNKVEKNQVSPSTDNAQSSPKGRKHKQATVEAVKPKKINLGKVVKNQNKQVEVDKTSSEIKKEDADISDTGTKRKISKRIGHKLHYIDLKQKVLQGDKESIENLETKIAHLMTRPSSNNKRRKLRTLTQIRKLLMIEKTTTVSPVEKKPIAKVVAKEGKKNNKSKKNKIPAKANLLDKVKVKAAVEESDGSDYNVEDAVISDKIKKEVKLEESSNDDSGDNNEEQSDKEDTSINVKKQSQQNKKNKKNAASPSSKSDAKKVRYILFVGNIPYDDNTQTLKEHFGKVANVQHIRLPLDQSNKPRGFAYVELATREDYEKALSLHHTILEGRRINVLYTKSRKTDKDTKKEIKAKNFKLQALRDQGKLAGSVKKTQKRSARRAKKNNAKN